VTELQARIERIEAQLAIQQLPVRYALAVDSRNVDDLIELFAADVDCGRWGRGRNALKAYFASPNLLSAFYRSVHLVCGHAIDLVDAGHATGTVYCRAGHEDDGHWVEMAICYFDRYVRSEGRWCFERRDEKHWYSADWQARPRGPSFQNWPGKYTAERYRPQLPQAWPSWQRYGDAAGDDARRAVTDSP
jgi:SnoaL-like protein